jgi:copper(I)-binding protein
MRVSLLLTLIVLLGACGQSPQPDLVAANVEVLRPMPGKAMTAAYLTLSNNSERTIIITRVTSKEYSLVQIHETIIEEGIARMRPLPQLEVPPGGNVKLERGGKHLMLMRPTGQTDAVALQFYDGETLLLSVNSGYSARASR